MKSIDKDLDELFRLPLADFTSARNARATQLKKTGHADYANYVKALAKPPISAWATNQLYWHHRDAFDRLLASGERFHKAQTAGKVPEMRSALDARREALTQLSDLAASLLREAGHNPSLDTIRRITTTLEALSVYASRSDAPRPGRLTQDVDPPGFESLGAFSPGPLKKTQTSTHKSERGQARRKLILVNAPQPKQSAEEKRKAAIAAAKTALQDAKRSLAEARATAQNSVAALKKANAEAQRAEKRKRSAEENLEKAEENLKKANLAAKDAAQRARTMAKEAEDAESDAEDAERAVEDANSHLNSLLRET